MTKTCGLCGLSFTDPVEFSTHMTQVHGWDRVHAPKGFSAASWIAGLTAIAWALQACGMSFAGLFCGDGRQGQESADCFRGAFGPLALTVIPVVAAGIAASRRNLPLALVFALATAVAVWLHWTSL